MSRLLEELLNEEDPEIVSSAREEADSILIDLKNQHPAGKPAEKSGRA